jgi:hypothetical protein
MGYADVTITGKTGWNDGLGSALSKVDLRHIARAQVIKKAKKQAA